jgi:methionyl-tRNA formyltransferase
MANGPVGVAVARHLTECGDQVVRLYLHDFGNQQCGEEIVAATGVSPRQTFFAHQTNDVDVVDSLSDLAPDFLITVYWSYLLKPRVFGIPTRGTVNFHPALLPINRGWYPHVHSIIDGTPCGVTLHAIDEGADTGPIWTQRPVPCSVLENAGTIHARLQEEMVRLFVDSWEGIKSGDITLSCQNDNKAIYRKKKDVDSLDRIDLDHQYTGRELLNLLRARTFGKRGFAYFEDPEYGKVYLHLQLNRDGRFE